MSDEKGVTIDRLREIASRFERGEMRLCACEAWTDVHIHPDGTCPLPRIPPAWKARIMVLPDLRDVALKVTFSGDGAIEVEDGGA